MSDAARLAAIRARLAAIGPGEWALASDGDGMLVEARSGGGEMLPILRFASVATSDEMRFAADAPETARFLLGLVDRAIVALRASGGRAGGDSRAAAAKDDAAEAAMKCAEPAFRVFLEERHGLARPLTDERVAQKLRSLLGVTSRRELNDGRDAAGAQSGNEAARRWADLRREFDAWRRAGR